MQVDLSLEIALGLHNTLPAVFVTQKHAHDGQIHDGNFGQSSGFFICKFIMFRYANFLFATKLTDHFQPKFNIIKHFHWLMRLAFPVFVQ